MKYGKEKIWKDIERRIWLFDILVWTILGYGVEICKWKEKDKLEREEAKCLRWILGVDWRTPGYMIREEIQRDMLRSRTARRAWNFGKRLEEGKGVRLARECLEEEKRKEKG